MVLIVDDLASRELLASYLEPEGCTIVTVSTGTEALEEARRSLPDLVVTDVLMPGSVAFKRCLFLETRPRPRIFLPSWFRESALESST